MFAGGAFVLVGVVIVLARMTQRELVPDPDGGAFVADHHLSLGQLYLNVVVSQGAVAVLVLALAWIAAIPLDALGIDAVSQRDAFGIALGVALYAGNAASVLLFDRIGIAYSNALRGALAPSRRRDWVLLLVGVLPVIAAVEEVIFRAALIGAIGSGFDVDPVFLVVLSSIAFAVGHGVQGTGGVLVTGVLGIVLGTAFVLSGSLLLVILAHYVVNVLEFVIHEGLDVEIP